MSGSSPLAAQANPSATRSFDSSTVAPGGTVTVTITFEGLYSDSRFGRLTEELPAGFEYVPDSATPDLSAVSDAAQGSLVFNLIRDPSVSYKVTAPDTEGPYPFDGTIIHIGPAPDGTETEYPVGGASSVTVEAGAETPDPTPEATPALPIPDLDDLSDAEATAIFSAAAGNDVEYTAASGDDDAEIVTRVSPGAEAIFDIDLGITVPAGQQINFSLTDGANLDFRIKKTGDAKAEIVVKDGVTLTAGQNKFQLVVNEFKNAPANTEDVYVVVHVVIDNEPPDVHGQCADATGTVAERAVDAEIATFSASDVNNQVLSFDIVAKVDDEERTSWTRALPAFSPAWIEMRSEHSGVLKTDRFS